MAPDCPLPDGVAAQLEKILSSQALGAAGSQAARLLRFVVERTLEGREDEIKESVLGLEVFGRPSFDPRTDPIVRVEASRLRQKLTSYYQSEGKEDGLRILLPKRGYVPVFEYVDGPTLATAAPTSSDSRREKIAWGISAVFVLTTMALGLAYWRQSSREVESLKLSILPPREAAFIGTANISPDGRSLAFVAS